MKLTNKLRLPEPIFQALQPENRYREGAFSVTQLINSPRITQLTVRHWDELEQDVSDRIWLLLGLGVHAHLEKMGVGDSEKLLEARIENWAITGHPDLYQDGVLSDYKVTSAWSIVYGVRPSWEAQLNMYAYLCQANGVDAWSLQIVAFLRDWNYSRMKESASYPRTNVVVLPITAWTHEYTDNYARVRLGLHAGAVELPDDQLPFCTAEERWEKDTKWAVKKQGNKRAKRVLDDEEEAYKMAARANDLYVECRPGKSVRCERYCMVSEFCNQWKEMQDGCAENTW